MKAITKEVKIGIAGIISLFLVIYGINYLKGVNMFKSSSYYYIKFPNVNGLAKSAPIYADGVRIGIVRDIIYDYEQPENIHVEIEVNEDLRLPKGSSAELVSELMGGVRMNLLLANNPREKYMVGDTLTGHINNGIMAGVEGIMPKVERMLPKLDSILTSLNTLLADQSIPATLHSIENITANLENTSKQLNNLMSTDIPQITGKINSIGDNFLTISNNLKQVDYANTLQKIDQTIAEVKSITQKLNQSNNSFGLLLNDKELYNNLNQTAINAASLLKDLESHPKRYVHFSLFGKKDK